MPAGLRVGRLSTVKALILTAPSHLVYGEVPVADLSDDDVLVEVRACGICGSDVHGMDGSTGRRLPPLVMGHECERLVRGRAGHLRLDRVLRQVPLLPPGTGQPL
jgi:hypothetical protein